MTRTLSTSLKNELATNKLNPIDLVYIGVENGYYFTDHFKNITFNTNTYQSSSLYLGATDVNESSEVSVSNLVVKFTGADQTIISLFLNNEYMEKPSHVYRGFLDDNSNLITDPFLWFEGRIENLSIEEDETSSIVNVSIASHWADFDKIKGRKTNTNSQKIHFPNDKGFDYASQTSKDIKWGKA